MTFQERIALAFQRENDRRASVGEDRLTKTALWKAAKISSGAVSQWFSGPGGASLEACIGIAPELKVNPFWLYNESMKESDPWPTAQDQTATVTRESTTDHEEIVPTELAELITIFQGANKTGRNLILTAARNVLKKSVRGKGRAVNE